MKVELAEYNPNWPIAFEEEKIRLQEVLKDIDPVIEHVGSTAVPGLIAKPIVDI